ncbi:MAG TPA: hypothetical protein VK638_09985 [Edaphobacter sp.]|nr:hypothetical protein [Edaphobacter sp.]
MRPSRPHPPKSQRLFVAGSIRGIICGLDFREPLHAGGVDFCDPVLEGRALDFVFDFAIPEDAFQGDELPLLESLGELREIPPGIDTVPFGAGFVFALVVLPAFLGCNVEDDVLFVVLSGFGFRVLPEAADEDDFVDYVESDRCVKLVDSSRFAATVTDGDKCIYRYLSAHVPTPHNEESFTFTLLCLR